MTEYETIKDKINKSFGKSYGIFAGSHFNEMLNRLAEIEKLSAYSEICVASLYADLKLKYNGRIAHQMLFKGFETRAKEHELSVERYLEEVLGL